MFNIGEFIGIGGLSDVETDGGLRLSPREMKAWGGVEMNSIKKGLLSD